MSNFLEINEIVNMDSDAYVNLLTRDFSTKKTTPGVKNCFVKKNKKIESRIGYCTKYNKLDRAKISKCYHCNNIVDLTKEGLNHESLVNYGKLSEVVALHIRDSVCL